jgi:hypothetical protein
MLPAMLCCVWSTAPPTPRTGGEHACSRSPYDRIEQGADLLLGSPCLRSFCPQPLRVRCWWGSWPGHGRVCGGRSWTPNRPLAVWAARLRQRCSVWQVLCLTWVAVAEGQLPKGHDLCPEVPAESAQPLGSPSGVTRSLRHSVYAYLPVPYPILLVPPVLLVSLLHLSILSILSLLSHLFFLPCLPCLALLSYLPRLSFLSCLPVLFRLP